MGQTVTVTAGQDDDDEDDTATLTHTAAGGNYAGETVELGVTVVDDDRGIVLTPMSLSVDEADATGATYTVKLATQSDEAVTVTVAGQANTDLTLTGLSATNTLTFTTSNWSMGQTVTVKAGQDDDGVDDTATLTHTAAGGEYDTVKAELPVTVRDDRSIVLSKSSLSVDEGDATGATYTVKLSHLPSDTVTVTVTGPADTGLTLDDITLTFTTANWNMAQTVTVKAGDDAGWMDDTATLTHTAEGADYADVTAELLVTVVDDDRGIVLTPTSLSVDEGGTTGATYTVKLSHVPTQAVTITVTGQANTDLTLTGLSTTNTLTFTTSNWNMAQTVTVKADQDTDWLDDTATLTHTAAGQSTPR